MNVKASLALVAALAATNSLVAQEAQPSGQASGGGTVPGMSASGASRGASSAGTAASRPFV